ncbi:MAG: sugar ABC transporter ATP-binding protein [Rhodobacteraceae bacterium]|uniref:Monosaccharide ABC transporter ATP-binding protein, CUT2 family n=1 Tax=Salipiger profundus TaxID=1229727 RepID=A0A1U7DA52_9RHOB|nr:MULTISPECIES: sugar ABC transporter ATP-binding protein [Salipiger]APX24935.1 monosaccharide ABC transporter ATP-binding protein, CUT2 family [Salipiger profundus]MAB07848.1 sugar ABC transporter ATP-binding protein [Paracoccaceae bacterium]GFZ99010.1 ABC transporter ATP-binding protein [Salipiger profundus]SFC94688.1 monosaccharide ABC transporter ATP-binding protein, CUT2 family [Salipiger profundus]
MTEFSEIKVPENKGKDPVLLEIRNATKEFKGVPANRDVSLSIDRGQVHALLGENGAGKSTLMKALAGVHTYTSGKIILDGEEIVLHSPADALDAGIAMVFQETSLVNSMTVAQNIYLGQEKLLNRLRGFYIEAQQFLLSMNFRIDPRAVVSSLNAAQRQMVEVARAVHHKAKIIIFDEPTATLTPEEKHHFFGLLERLKAQGTAIFFISHALEEALEYADTITVLRDGELVANGPAADFTRESIVNAMVGRSLSEELYGGEHAKPENNRHAGRKLLSVSNLSMGEAVRNTSFTLYEGQVTGIFGLVGAGRTEMMKVVAGAFKRNIFHGGEIKFEGRPVRYRVPRQAVMDGIVYVTEDRKADGFFDTMSIAENIYLGDLAMGRNPFTVMSMSRMRKLAEEWTTSLNIRAIDTGAQVNELSGGNQQKVVIAKSLVQKPRLVILDEPTRGVDVGSIAEIHGFINQLADSGITVAMISSYLPEILSVSDRILVARQGQIVEEMRAADATEAKIMYAAVH